MKVKIPQLHALCVAAIVFVGVLTMGFASFAGAGGGDSQTPKKATPTAAEIRWESVKLLEDTLLWNATVKWNAVATWNYVAAANYAQAIIDAQAREAAAAEAARQRQFQQRTALPRPTAPARTNASVGGACGGSVRDDVIADESGGNPNARNASGAWGCYQIMPGTWAGAGCEGAHGSATVAQQAACADKVNAGNPSAWAASGN